MLLALRSLYETPRSGGRRRRSYREPVQQFAPPQSVSVDGTAYLAGVEMRFSAGQIEATGGAGAKINGARFGGEPNDDAEALAIIMASL